MQTILDILRSAGGWHPGLSLTLDNTPYMPLVIEAMDEAGPCGLSALSVAHYREQNGDLMRDPEMCFELSFAGDVGDPNPFYYRNDLVADSWMVSMAMFWNSLLFYTVVLLVFRPIRPAKAKKTTGTRKRLAA